jgi:hypothetical protein
LLNYPWQKSTKFRIPVNYMASTETVHNIAPTVHQLTVASSLNALKGVMLDA